MFFPFQIVKYTICLFSIWFEIMFPNTPECMSFSIFREFSEFYMHCIHYKKAKVAAICF